MKTVYKLLITILVLGTLVIMYVNSQSGINYSDMEKPIPPLPDKIKATVKLYFAEEDKLVGEYRTVIISDLKFERIIVEELIKGPRNKILKSTIPENAKIISIETIDNICYVNLSNHFINNNKWNKINPQLIIWSLVNSLTELDYIQKVQVLVEGERIDLKEYNYSFKEPFVSNVELIKKKEQTPFGIVTDFLNCIMSERFDKAYEMIDRLSKDKIEFKEFRERMALYVREINNYSIKIYNTQLYSDSIIVSITYGIVEDNYEFSNTFTEDWKLIVEEGNWKIVLSEKFKKENLN